MIGRDGTPAFGQHPQLAATLARVADDGELRLAGEKAYQAWLVGGLGWGGVGWGWSCRRGQVEKAYRAWLVGWWSVVVATTWHGSRGKEGEGTACLSYLPLCWDPPPPGSIPLHMHQWPSNMPASQPSP